jgi:transcriptional regulator with XRE-family HTH domain
MSLISDNLKYLRKQNGFTQEQMAEKIGIKRSLLGAYEEGRAEPRLDNLLNICRIFNVPMDVLISKDVRSEITAPAGKNGSTSGNSLPVVAGASTKVLAITVDNNDRENIELVKQKAAAGYLNGYADPEFIGELPKFQLPLFPTGSYRAFEISGDSMLPLQSGDIVIGQYVENYRDIKSGRTYVLVTSKEGVVYKRVFNYVNENGKLFLSSDNKIYSPYEVKIEEVVEVWEARAFISVKFPDPVTGTPVNTTTDDGHMTLEKLSSIVIELQQEVIRLKGK